MRVIVLWVLALKMFAATGGAPVILGASNGQIFYEIDVSVRGTQILELFQTLQPRLTTNLYSPPIIEMQTTLSPGIPYAGYQGIYPNGIIPYIQNITGTPHNTLLLVTYLTPKYSTPYPFYLVLPVEQVTTLLFFENIFKLPTPSVAAAPPFVASFPPNVTPYYTVNPTLRAADIVSIVAQLRNLFTQPDMNQVWIQTGVTGPYRDPFTPNGLLKNVLSASIVGNGLIEIVYHPSDQVPQDTGRVYVSAEQVQQIMFLRYYTAPSSP